MKAAFVIPFYGADIGGGAEAQCRMLAERLVARGAPIEVLTTNLRDLTSHWNHHYYDPGIYAINGVNVHRFAADHVNTDLFVPINLRLIAREAVSLEEELDWAGNAVNSETMFKFIACHRNEYVYFFMPYCFGTSINGTKMAPERSFLIPCLHDEAYATMRVTRAMFERVNAVLFNSRGEMRLAKRLYGGLAQTEPILMGEGVDSVDGADGARFRTKHGLGDDPFILYVGRRDATKNTPQLVEYFWRYRALRPESTLRLVSMGPGGMPVPGEIATSALDLGFVPAEEKRDALAAATMLCQPSLKESFSLAVMESWLCGRPALVHAGCEATTDHVLDSGGGLPFGSFPEFFEAVELLLKNPELADAMGARGKAYVESHYSWDVICGRFMRLLEACGELVK